ncbi:PTS lactose/cellobiose transporter subunit IIA [uncultured Holdemanella sp.]|uniref:PTS lactose/cellobiose transporter subunit IIA n=1 Tax=uncultured Holdemanella sp. TaxID=1763549 RepID=UPI0025DB8611|nr:PTS lactose/cellobiose transporter subunit IIA [uncultured Holdemanella sp.]
MENLDVISCQIIAASGGAKSSYIEAIELAKQNDFDGANERIKEGDQVYQQGHAAHAKLIQMSAQGKLEIPLLLMHAEDQMMNCETMKIFAQEMIYLLKQNFDLKNKIEKGV